MKSEDVPRDWSMFSLQANAVVTHVVAHWVRSVENEEFWRDDPIEELDRKLEAVERQYPEITDTEPRENLAWVVQEVLTEHGLNPNDAQRSKYAASLWHPHDRRPVEPERGQRETTVTMRVDDVNPGHCWVSVFVGRNPGSRGYAGRLTFRTDELAELLDLDSAQLIEGRRFEVVFGDYLKFGPGRVAGTGERMER